MSPPATGRLAVTAMPLAASEALRPVQSGTVPIGEALRLAAQRQAEIGLVE